MNYTLGAILMRAEDLLCTISKWGLKLSQARSTTLDRFFYVSVFEWPLLTSS